MHEKSETDRGRLTRFLASLFFIGGGLAGILTACHSKGLSPLFPLSVFVVFIVASAIIIALIAGRLYAQHEIRRFKFDLANLVLITTLASLPFAAAGTFWNQIQKNSTIAIQDNAMSITIMIATALLFLMLPILLITEALLAWWRVLTRRDG